MTKFTIKGIIFAAIVLFAVSAQAQVTFKPGLRAGANFSHFTKGDLVNGQSYYYDGNGQSVYYNNRESFGTLTDFYIGFYGTLKLSKYYALQPEFTYSNQGTEFTGYLQDYYGSSNAPVAVSQKLKVSYLSAAIINKFYFNKAFNIHLGPTVDFVVDKQNFVPDNDIDFAFILGAGYEMTNGLGFEARIKKGIVPVLDGYEYYDESHTNVVFSLGLTYTFTIK